MVDLISEYGKDALHCFLNFYQNLLASVDDTNNAHWRKIYSKEYGIHKPQEV